MASIVGLSLDCITLYTGIQLFLFPREIFLGFPEKHHIKAALGRVFQEYGVDMFYQLFPQEHGGRKGPPVLPRGQELNLNVLVLKNTAHSLTLKGAPEAH